MRKITEDLRSPRVRTHGSVANRCLRSEIARRDRAITKSPTVHRAQVLGIKYQMARRMQIRRLVEYRIVYRDLMGIPHPGDAVALRSCVFPDAKQMPPTYVFTGNKTPLHAMPKSKEHDRRSIPRRVATDRKSLPHRAYLVSDDGRDILIRAAARIAGSLAELLLRVGLLLEFRYPSASGIDEPVAYLFTHVSAIAPRPSSRTHLSHRETGAPAKHLLLFLGGVGMREVLLEPLFQHIRNVPG